jgi:hypothetical protein
MRKGCICGFPIAARSAGRIASGTPSARRGGWDLRLADTGIDVSDDGWDSEMIEYPFVFKHDGLRYMLYNGNGYGRSGFGLAVASRE